MEFYPGFENQPKRKYTKRKNVPLTVSEKTTLTILRNYLDTDGLSSLSEQGHKTLKELESREVHIFVLNTLIGAIEIYENRKYKWNGQKGLFYKEDTDIFAWYPGSIENGTPSYFSQQDIQNISDNAGVPQYN